MRTCVLILSARVRMRVPISSLRYWYATHHNRLSESPVIDRPDQLAFPVNARSSEMKEIARNHDVVFISPPRVAPTHSLFSHNRTRLNGMAQQCQSKEITRPSGWLSSECQAIHARRWIALILRHTHFWVLELQDDFHSFTQTWNKYMLKQSTIINFISVKITKKGSPLNLAVQQPKRAQLTQLCTIN